MNVRDKQPFAKGKRGVVSTANMNGRTVMIKEKNPASAVDTLAHEAEMLCVVNKKGIGPLFIAFNDHGLVMEFIEGVEFGKWVAQAKKQHIKQALLDILAQCYTLDMLGINKLEMTHPHKHILMRKNKPVFIDFERARRTEKPKNVTQVCQYITSKDLGAAFLAKDILIPRAVMLEHAKQYKQRYGKSSYEHMREVIMNA